MHQQQVQVVHWFEEKPRWRGGYVSVRVSDVYRSVRHRFKGSDRQHFC